MGVKSSKKERTLEDLKGILERVSQKYLGRSLPDVTVEWGRYRKPKERRRHIYLGLYLLRESVIRVHSVLRQPWVPDFFVEYVVYHEVLHHVMPPEMKQHALRLIKRGAQPNYHPDVFLLAERLFQNFDRAVQWEQKNIDRLLTS
jgi:hypothetical protein